jgi:pimeloyl-ACP methyl ester carboxylesterase
LVAKPLAGEDGLNVVYDQVKVGDRRIRVIITHPQGVGPFPTLFLIGGIGAYSVDAPFASAPYGNVLGPIAKSGYATIRVEKPGQGDSEGPVYTDLLFEDELKAYVGAMKLAKTLTVVDKNRIAVFGHSMGGTFGPLLFAEEPFAGLAVNGTLARTWLEYLAGSPAAQVDQFMRPFATVNQLLFNDQWSLAEVKEKRPDLAPILTQISPDGKTMSGVGIPFFQQLAKRNLGEAWGKVTVPTLVTWGENDFISGESCHVMIRDIVNTAKPGVAEYVKLSNSDHGFNETASFRDSMTTWGQPGGKFNANIVETLKSWLDRTLKNSK